jgi:hypothetical protein
MQSIRNLLQRTRRHVRPRCSTLHIVDTMIKGPGGYSALTEQRFQEYMSFIILS